MSQGTEQSSAINSDVFKYENSEMSQCISGFGRNLLELIADGPSENEPASEHSSRVAWHINELVRWCQHFNGKSQRLEAALIEIRAVLSARTATAPKELDDEADQT
jgi:hypothetical protein